MLIKVAETIARRLVAKVVIDEAIQEALNRIQDEVHSSDEEDSCSYDTAYEEQACPPWYFTIFFLIRSPLDFFLEIFSFKIP